MPCHTKCIDLQALQTPPPYSTGPPTLPPYATGPPTLATILEDITSIF